MTSFTSVSFSVYVSFDETTLDRYEIRRVAAPVHSHEEEKH